MRLAIIGLDSSHCAHFVRFITGSGSSPGGPITLSGPLTPGAPLTLSALVSIPAQPSDPKTPSPWDDLLPLIPYPVMTLTGAPDLIAQKLAPHCDAAIIASRDSSTHHAYAHALLSVGIATFVDKPFTRTAAEAQELVDVATTTGTALTSFSALRWHPLIVASARRRAASLTPGASYTVYGSAPASQYGPDFLAVHPIEAALTLAPGLLVESHAHRTGDLITLDLLSRHNGQNHRTRAVINVDPQDYTDFGVQRGSGPITPVTLDQDYLLPGFTAWHRGLQTGNNPVPLADLVQTVSLTERVTALM